MALSFQSIDTIMLYFQPINFEDNTTGAVLRLL